MNDQNELDLLQKWLGSWLSNGSSQDFNLAILAGDGSPRKFYRLRTPDRSYVVMHDPKWEFSGDYPVLQQYLKAKAIAVPDFYEVDVAAGVIVMEDLSDQLLQSEVLLHPEQKMHWLTKSIALLAQLQNQTYPVPTDLPVAERVFDAKKYSEELSFTQKYLHVGLFNLKPDLFPKEEIATFSSQIETIGPQVFSQRDYHCRNLLVKDGSLYLIDFQDARMGPPHYDLASLIYDAYVPLDEKERTELVRCYLSEIKGCAFEISSNEFETELAAIAFQRLVKAAGSFASFYLRYQKPTHLPYLMPALSSALYLQRLIKDKYAVASFPIEAWISALTHSGIGAGHG